MESIQNLGSPTGREMERMALGLRAQEWSIVGKRPAAGVRGGAGGLRGIDARFRDHRVPVDGGIKMKLEGRWTFGSFPGCLREKSKNR